MRFIVVLVAALVLCGSAQAIDVHVVTLSPVQDMSLPFWCDWGYDWDERCYRDDSDRLGVGGVDDKVWRAAVRFSLGVLPPQASVITAELSLWYDRTCVAPRRRTRSCDGRGFDLDAHPIFSPDWLHEREVELGPAVAAAPLGANAAPQWLVWDLTDVVADWQSGGMANDGVLLELADGQEGYDTSGPAFPSSTFADAGLRPRLAVWYVVG